MKYVLIVMRRGLGLTNYKLMTAEALPREGEEISVNLADGELHLYVEAVVHEVYAADTVIEVYADIRYAPDDETREELQEWLTAAGFTSTPPFTPNPITKEK